MSKRELTQDEFASMRRACLTKKELAEVLQVSENAVLEMVREGCPCINLQRKTVHAPYAALRFDLDKILLWLSSFNAPCVPLHR